MEIKKISAEIVADSVSPQGHRITTFLLTYPRFIHGELMTHRLFSRNSASSRAIPFNKMVQMVEEDPFIPIAWQKDHKGMQGNKYINDLSEIARVGESWLMASRQAVLMAKVLNEQGLTKQLCNRLLESFMWHTVLVTATEYDNFFELRCPQYSFGKNTNTPKIWKSRKDSIKDFPDWENRNDLFWYLINNSQAEIHIQALAEAMWDSLNESTPRLLKTGEWHIPFGDRMNTSSEDSDLLWQSFKNLRKSGEYEYSSIPTEVLIATARCARLSYMTFDGEINYEKDIKLHDTLLESKHFSPFEHCAKCMSDEEYYSFVKGEISTGEDGEGTIVNYEYYPYVKDNIWGDSASKWIDFVGNNPNNNNKFGWCNNFRGFIQYRYILENDTTK